MSHERIIEITRLLNNPSISSIDREQLKGELEQLHARLDLERCIAYPNGPTGHGDQCLSDAHPGN